MVSPRNIRLALAILVVTATIGIVAAIIQKGSSPAPPVQVSQQLPLNVDVALRNARFSESRDGRTVWTMVSERAEYDKSGEMAYLDGIRMEFDRSGSAGKITVTAAKGTYSTKTRNVSLRGKVHVFTESGAFFDTESLNYQAPQAHFSTTDTVSFRQQRITLTARGMTLGVDDQVAHFSNSVDAVVAVMKSR
jgi:LPS export ABC transporter protein LptC